MSKLVEQLKYETNSTQYGVDLYSKQAEVGSHYITLRVDGQLAYAQTGRIGDKGNSHLRIKDKEGNVLAVNSSAQDERMLLDGEVANPSHYGSVTPTSATYDGTGQNVTENFVGTVVLPSMTNSQMYVRVTAELFHDIVLDATTSYKLYYGSSTSTVTNLAGTFTNDRISVDLTGISNPLFLKAVAVNSGGETLYESAVYCLNLPNYGVIGATQKLRASTSSGEFEATVYSGRAEAGGTATWDMGTNANYRYYKAGVNTPSYGDNYGSLNCADTCTCNCNYCTCNCNYCTCNCNYCTCNCNYSPCSCSCSCASD